MPALKKVKPKPDEIDICVGENLKTFRLLRGLSQEAVARESGVSFQQIQKYEQGVNRISASRLFAFSKLLEVNLSDFFPGTGGGKVSPDFAVLSELDKSTLALLREFRSIKCKHKQKALLDILKRLQELLESADKDRG